jgi:multiple sugar transport system substrate-binding protein
MNKKQWLAMSLILVLVALFTVQCVAVQPAANPPAAEEAEPAADTTGAEMTEEEAEPAEADSAAEGSEEAVKIVWWSHWAEETNKRGVLEQVAADYTAENPNVEIEFVWWQKEEMFNAIQNTMTAGEGFPDIFYIDRTAPQIPDAGWAADLSEGVNWDNVDAWAKESWTWPNGEVYAVALEASTLELYYNKRIFDELGIELPEDGQLTAEEFFNAAQACREAGYDVFAGAQQWWGSGALLFWYALEHTMGVEEFAKYFTGQVPVDTPEARAALEWANSVVSLPAYGESYATKTIAEAHQDFHTKENACMFPVGSWYTGRAFVPPEQGGQPAEFQLGCMPWPAMPDGSANNEHLIYAAGSVAAAELSPNKEVAIDIIDFLAQEKYGNLWMAKTGVQTGIKTDLATMPETEFDWYFTEFDDCKPTMDRVPINVFSQPPAFRETWIQVFNEGLPLGIIDVDEGLQRLEAARQQ